MTDRSLPGELTFCSSCLAPMVWLVTAKNGKRIPLDPGSVAGGNLDIDDDGRVVYVKADPDVKRFVSHFASCPNAKSHRR